MNDVLTEARDLLTRKRDECLAEIAQIDKALDALSGVGGGSPSNGAAPEKSVRTMVFDLFGEADRDWSVAEVLDEYERRGRPVHGKDPGNALRAALSAAFRQDKVERTAPGRYRATKWVAGSEADSPGVANFGT